MASAKELLLIFLFLVTSLTSMKCDTTWYKTNNETSSKLTAAAVIQQLKRISGSATPSMTSSTVPIINVYPKSSLNQVEVELMYEKSEFPNGFHVSLMFDGNENTTDCSNPTNLKKVYDSCTTSESITLKVHCDNQKPGLYCARAHELVPGGDFGEVFYTNMSRLDDLNRLTSETAIVSEIRQSEPNATDATKIISIALGICCSLTVLFILGLIFMRRKPNPHPSLYPDPVKESVDKLKLVDAIRNLPRVKVFLLYYPECSHHLDFIELLVQFLTLNNCEVSYDQNELNMIAINTPSWIQNKLSGRYKILIINSPTATKQQRIWLQNKGVVINDSLSNEGDIFLSALAILTHRTEQAFNYRSVSMLRPSYVSKADVLQNICPGIQYEVPTHLTDLVSNLHELDSQSVDLNVSESELFEHCYSSYSALLDLSREISGSNESNAHFASTPSCQKCNSMTDMMNDSHDRLLAV